MTYDKNASDEAKIAYFKALMTSYIDAFNAKNVDAICACYAEDALVEDPVGDPKKYYKGQDAIRAFYTASTQRASLQITAPIRVGHGAFGSGAAMNVRASLKGMEIDVISVAKFNVAGQIEHYRAYWTKGDIRQVPE